MDIQAIEAYESGELNLEETVVLFQDLIDFGDAWRLQGFYGRMAHEMLKKGHCTLGPHEVKNYWGKTIPSRYQVAPGELGSEEYCARMRNNPVISDDLGERGDVMPKGKKVLLSVLEPSEGPCIFTGKKDKCVKVEFSDGSFTGKVNWDELWNVIQRNNSDTAGVKSVEK